MLRGTVTRLQTSLKQDRGLWLWLAVVIMGIALFEATSKIVVHRETVYGDYSSYTHLLMLSGATAGLCIAMYGVAMIYTEVSQSGKASLNTFTPHSHVHELP